MEFVEAKLKSVKQKFYVQCPQEAAAYRQEMLLNITSHVLYYLSADS